MGLVALTGLGLCTVASAADAEPIGPSEEALAAIAQLDADDAYQQQAAFLKLEALREPATAETVRRYVDHRDPDVRGYSLRALAAIEGLEAVELLLERVAAEREATVRREALQALEVFHGQDDRLLPVFIDALRDRSTEVRMAVVDIVSRIDDPRAREAIITRHQKEQRRDVRRVLKLAVERLRRP